MTENLLILTPESPFDAPTTAEALEEKLRAIGFIDEPFELNGERHLKPGPEFMYLLTFLGCSPAVSLGEPGKTGEEFAHVRIDGPLDAPVCLTGDNVKIPRCRCGYRLDEWRDEAAVWKKEPEAYRFNCPKCERETPLHELRWKKCAAFGRLLVMVWGVFESEAVPGDKLKAALRECGGGEWQVSYLRRSN